METAEAEYNKKNIERLGAMNVQATDKLFTQSKETLEKQRADNDATIKALEAERDTALSQRSGNAADIMADKMGIAGPAPAPPPPPPNADKKEEKKDYFTSVSVEVSSSYQHDQSKEKSQSTSASVSAGFSFGLSVSGSASHSSASADAQSQMADASVKIKFDCMRVDIERPWLRAELFYDDDLQTAPGALYVHSKSYMGLHRLIRYNSKSQDLAGTTQAWCAHGSRQLPDRGRWR